MEPQYFKGDATEVKFDEAGKAPFELTDASLNEFYENGYNASPFLLMLYDEGRFPFSERINRESFVEFIKETLQRFPFMGTFDSYLFILRAIFGELSEINFDVPAAGKLNISINATTSLEFDFIGREVSGGVIETFEMIDYNGDILTFRGIAGIDSEYQLGLLFSEIMPAGIYPTIALSFFTYYNFIAEDAGGDLFDVIDYSGEHQIVFYEIGG